MKLRFKQRFFSWLDSYDVFDDAGNTVFSVEGKLSLGHCLHIHNEFGVHIATLRERIFTFLPAFEMYVGDTLVGTVKKEFTFFSPRFRMECRDWTVEGDFFEWDYRILRGDGRCVAVVEKELFRMTDTYTIDVADEADALAALLVVLAIDAEKCSRD